MKTRPKIHNWIIRWIGYDPDFSLNRMDARFKHWAIKGLRKHSDLYERGTLRSFQDLKKRFGLTSQDLYRFLQLRHYLRKTMRKEELQQKKMKIFLLGYRSDLGHGNISKIYNVLQKQQREILHTLRRNRRRGVTSRCRWKHGNK